MKIFFGYAAGIGKTYAMLESAHKLKEEGSDVVAGYIEPHSRPETMALLEGLEVLPAKSVEYRGLHLHEFDLEAALVRRPEVVLVDELAHTNAAGSIHAKRYQDIKELLKAGIHVYTTVNVQHLESLNDAIAGITGVVVRERIPDSIFDNADQVELVDIEPEELLERLKQGKIYRTKQAGRAMEHFFTRDNLVSLREIALRRMADRVNLSQNHMVNTGNETVEHLLVCLSSSPSNGKVIRQAARMANAFHGRLTALYVETQDAAGMSRENVKGLNENIYLAKQLGAHVVMSYGKDVVEEIAEYAKVARVSKIVLGRTYTNRRILFIRDSVSEQLTRLAPQVEIFLIPDAYDKQYRRRKKQGEDVPDGKIWMDLSICLCSLFICSVAAWGFTLLGVGDANVAMVYILGVLMTALLTNHQIWGILNSVFSVLIFSYFFTEPVCRFSFTKPEHLITFAVLFATSLCCSTLTKKVKNYGRQNARKAYRTELLLETSRKLQGAKSAGEIAEQTTEQLGKLLERNIYFFLGNPTKENLPFIYNRQAGVCLRREDAPDILEESEFGTAQWTFRNNKHAGFSTGTLPGSRCMFLAVRNGETVFAVVGIDMERKKIPAFEESVMGAILNECAFALEKEALLEQQKESELRLEKEQVRANLLRSISHDLRTPLTGISGSAQALLVNEESISKEQREQIYQYIYDDSVWLINLVENLLSVTRIENGTVELKLQGEIVEDVIAEAISHVTSKTHLYVNQHGKQQRISVDCEEFLMAKMDVKLMVQVVMNLVDNAVKYTPEGSKIMVTARKRGRKAMISVSDNGPGISDEQKSRLFQMFYAGEGAVSDGRRGMGLGLSLVQSIVRAHGGELKVFDNVPQGTVFQFELDTEEVKL